MKFESISEACVMWKKDLDNAILGEIKQKAIEHGIKTEYVLNEKAIINALKKQIPKKAIVHGLREGREINTVSYTCPVCNNHIGRDDYCTHCGQKLEWGDTK
jgi:predicted RNA-binding Zn-ribbon protein involved in translation (DUF1610 family)